MNRLTFRHNLAALVFSLAQWLAILFGDVGCSLDPNGGCRETPPADELDVGCSLDPDGRCREPVGCSADPNGGGCHG